MTLSNSSGRLHADIINCSALFLDYEEDDHAEELRFADKNNSNCADRSTNYMSDRKSGDSRVDAKTNNSRAKVRELASKSEDVKRASSAKSNSTGSTKDPRIEVRISHCNMS